MSATTKKCIECGGAAHPVRIIDRGNQNIEYELTYTSDQGRRNPFTGHKKEGKVAAELCDICGRITLRAASR